MENTHRHKKVQELKPKAPPAVTAQRAGLHPQSKLVQGVLNINKKKGS